jgi:hypothetical protein
MVSDVICRQDLVEADLCCLMCGRMVGRLVGFGWREQQQTARPGGWSD